VFSTYAKLPTPKSTVSKPVAASNFLSVLEEASIAHKAVGNDKGRAGANDLPVQQSPDIAFAITYSSLPKLNAQTFDGKSLEYHQFIRSFESMFKAIKDPERKFQYLLCCCRGKVYQVIETCSKISPASRAY